MKAAERWLEFPLAVGIGSVSPLAYLCILSVLQLILV